MFKIHYLNKISPKGTAQWTEDYAVTDSLEEADAVLALAQKTPENPRPRPKYVSGYYTDGIFKRAIDSGHWQTFGYTLEKIAQHGCVAALKQEVSQ